MFTDIKKRKELIDREVELYKKEQLLKVDIEIEAYKAGRNRLIEDMGRKCAEQLGSYEHEFHFAKETKGIEIAKLEAKKETLEQVVTANEALLKQKDAEIERLNETVKLLIANQPKTVVQNSKCGG